MPEYELRLRFTAADGLQASRLADAWACTCAAEYGTRYAGFTLVEQDEPPPSEKGSSRKGIRDIPRLSHLALTDIRCMRECHLEPAESGRPRPVLEHRNGALITHLMTQENDP